MSTGNTPDRLPTYRLGANQGHGFLPPHLQILQVLTTCLTSQGLSVMTEAIDKA